MADNFILFSSEFDVVEAYASGFPGVRPPTDEESAEFYGAIEASGGTRDGGMACRSYGLAESGKGKLSLPFLEIYSLYPDCLPGGRQERGDCVSWSTRNAALGTMCCEITSGSADEVTGRVEGAPAVSDKARLNGVLSTEAIYNWRRHGGDGWSCQAAAAVLLKESGLWLRKKYDEIDVDFTEYSGRNAGLYGSNTPPASWLKVGADHLMRTATEVESYETLRDLLHNGYCVSSCGSEGFSAERDENGVSRRQGGWAHALAYLGVDDRPEIIELYGEPLILIQNSWAAWNSGSRRIYKTTIDIPVGSFWARWSDIKNRYMVAFSGVNGWPPKKLAHFGSIGNI
jgi:hypothetical protein